jgi:hypothetical protein
VTVLGLYLRSRSLPGLLLGMLVIGAVLFTPIGSYLVPRTDLSVFDLETPLRLYATALLAAFPCAAVGVGSLPVERSAHATWPVLHLGGGLILIAVGALTLSVGCAVVSVERVPVVLAFLVLTGVSLIASAFVGPAGWTLAAGYSTLCAVLGTPDTGWAVLMHPPQTTTWFLAGALLVIGMACHLTRNREPADDD